MTRKCSYCWKSPRDRIKLIVLDCGHELCKLCLVFIKKNEIDYCPICRKEIQESMLDNINSYLDEELSRTFSQSKQSMLSTQLEEYHSISDLFLTSIKLFKTVNNFSMFDPSSLNILSKAFPTMPEILSDLNLIRQFNIHNLSSLNESQLNLTLSSKPFRRVFCKIMFKEIELKYNDKNILWLGSRLRIIANDNNQNLLTITNNGIRSLFVYSIAFGININSPNKFYLNKINFIFTEEMFYANGNEFVKDNNKISFSLKFPCREIKPNQALQIYYELENGLYLCIKNQEVLEFNGCTIISSIQSKYSLLVSLKFK